MQAHSDPETLGGWLGNSRVVDEDSCPLAVYHGTNNDFAVFDTSISENDGEIGTFFTDNIEHAKEYGDRLITAYLRILNPYEVSGVDWAYGTGMTPAQAKAAGHDGYIVRGIEGGDYFIVFSVEQIYSVISPRGLADAQLEDGDDRPVVRF